MQDVNKIILVGRLGANPILRETKAGTSVVHFPLATSRRLRDDGEERDEPSHSEVTQWHRVVVWGKLGEFCSQYLKKGHPVYVEGSFRSHKYDTKEGESRVAFEVHAEKVSFLGSALRAVEASSSEKVAVSA
ncbi:MAG: hypothetical protein A2428_06470 [Bdellovibrionales bacterium RIFOXYC1_FULL_54_43]|nr:MAG: hypothetical protein A2428_06470 [Bdellovibrionales bacterium RIFOXYC1_FULL_54_43]OFZ85126.1 MAG: hypothetical protein A2603_07275 [Bdellovibrionales bacterium RIFOXYD1_FULL_55_31]